MIEGDTRVRQDEGRQLGQLSCKDGDTVAAGNMLLLRKHLETLNSTHMHSQRFSCTVINMSAKFCLLISEQFAYIPRFFLTTAAQCGAEKSVIFAFLFNFFYHLCSTIQRSASPKISSKSIKLGFKLHYSTKI